MPGEELNELQMPHSVMAEQAVLGSMLIQEKCIARVIEKLRAEDFYMRQNQDLFLVLFDMFNHCEAIDLVTVVARMKQSGGYTESAIVPYLQQLMEITPTTANVMDYVDIVAEKALLRRVGETAGEIAELVRREEGTGDQVLTAAEQRIYAIRQGRSASGLTHISSIMSEVYETVKTLQAQGGEFPGISTGLVDLDRRISGLNNSDLIILAARPGVGKSSLAMNIGVEAAKHSGRVYLATDPDREDEWGRVAMAVANLSQAKMYIDDDASLSVADINAKCRRIEDLGLIIIDYLQLMTSAGGVTRASDNRQQIVSDMSRALKLMAKELNVPVICLSQLSRANETRGTTQRRPMLSDLRDSGAIEQDADIVLFLYRDSYYDEDTDAPNLAECIVAKNRHGETGTVQLEWRPEFTTFRNYSYRDDEDDY